MRAYLIVAAITLCTSVVNGQVKNKKGEEIKKPSIQKVKNENASKAKKKSNLPPGTAIRGGKVVTLHHGKNNYTPGSPVGTGGAGGSTLSGSPQGSASQNAIGNKPSDELLEKSNHIKKKDIKVNPKKQ